MPFLFAFLMLFSLLLTPVARAQEAGKLNLHNVTRDRLVEAPDQFSYMAPEGWMVAEVTGVKYKVAITNPSNGVAPNLNVVDDSFKGTMDEYVRQNLEDLEKSFDEFKKLGQNSFTTTSGVKGVKVIIQARQQGKLLRQIFFLLRGKNDVKYVITFTASAEEGKKYDAIVEKAIKTFVLK